MSLDEFLDKSSREGRLDSEGAFTLNFDEAVLRLANFRLPSPEHYLLKVVQVASRLGAESVQIRLEQFRTAITFKVAHGGKLTDFASVKRAFLAPLEVNDPVLSDFSAALWGAQSETTQEILWSFSQGYRGRRVYIQGRTMRSEEFAIETPLDPGDEPCTFYLSVLHLRSWRFWTHSRRNAAALTLLSHNCGLSRVKLWVDGRALEKAPGSYLTRHRRLSSSSTGLWAQPYHIIFYEMVEKGGFEIGRPGLGQYVVRENHFNVWASGTRVSNGSLPDGVSAPAWMLQFRHQGEYQSVRQVVKYPRCRLVLAYDENEHRQEVPLQLTLVRQSVLIEHRPSLDWGKGIETWQGCHLVLDDDSLATDLTGFQILEGPELLSLLNSLEPHLLALKSCLAEGRHLLPQLGGRA